MQKRMWSVATLVVLVSLGGALAVRAAGTTVSMVETSQSDPTKDWKFDPADITVPAGSTVTWQNKGTQPHTVTADDGSFQSGSVSPGGSFQHTFPTAGDFTYHCEPHPWMKAVVHVTGASTPGTAATTTTTAAAGAASASTSTTATTAKPGTASTTTPAAASATTTTTAAAGAAGTTTTTAASNGTAASAAPATDNSTTTTTTAAAGEESAASSRGHGGGEKTDTPLVVLAGIVTLLLLALTVRLLGAKS